MLLELPNAMEPEIKTLARTSDPWMLVIMTTISDAHRLCCLDTTTAWELEDAA